MFGKYYFYYYYDGFDGYVVFSQGARTAKRVRLIPAELHFKKISEKNGEKKLKKTWQQNCHEVLVAFQV